MSAVSANYDVVSNVLIKDKVTNRHLVTLVFKAFSERYVRNASLLIIGFPSVTRLPPPPVENVKAMSQNLFTSPDRPWIGLGYL